jgi:tripeptide aminopeptidase
MTLLLDRFLKYVSIDTQSSEDSSTCPSTPGQWDLLRELERELRELGAGDVKLTEEGYLLAGIPASTPDRTSTIALLAHVDTAQDFSGKDVKPLVHNNYQGGSIALPDDPNCVLNYENSPHLKDKIGHTIITASGRTLLGGDDKAGIAIIMTLAEKLLKDPSIRHGPVRICFNPDEEITRGVDRLDLAELDADVAYTLDATEIGEVQYETFSADKAIVTIEGVSIHPGWAKNKMVNSIRLAGKLLASLPTEGISPETTDGRKGFIHPYRLEGDTAQAVLHFILRDYELDELEHKGGQLKQLCSDLQVAEPRARVNCEITEQYRNMRYWLENDMRPVEIAIKAAKACGMDVKNTPIRGGTDGAKLTEQGLPTPNLSASIYNAHGPLEWVSLNEMELAVGMLVKLLELWEQESKD